MSRLSLNGKSTSSNFFMIPPQKCKCVGNISSLSLLRNCGKDMSMLNV
jgi:hypothetical protein